MSLPIILVCLAVALLAGVYIRHRKEPVRIAGWLIPIAAPLFIGLLWGVFAWFDHEHDALARQTRDLNERSMDPMSSLEDVDLPQSSSRIILEQMPLIKVGRDTTVVARDLDVRGAADFAVTPMGQASPPPRRVASAEELRAAVEDVFDAKKREADLLGMPFDPMMTVAADRCLPVTRVVDAMGAATAVRLFHRFKLAVTGDGTTRVVDSKLGQVIPGAEDGGLDFLYKFLLTDAGVTFFVDGKALPAVEGCPENGPTVCIESPPAEPDCTPTYAWERLRQLVIDVHAETPDETVFLMIVGPGVPWQTAVQLADAVRLKDPGAGSDGDNELLPDLLLYDGTTPPPHQPRD